MTQQIVTRFRGLALRGPRHLAVVALACGFLLVPGVAHANPFVVTDAADSGPNTLRQAILDANGNAGADTITIDIASPTRSR